MSRFRILLLTTAALASPGLVHAATFDITNGTSTTAQSLSGTETGNVRSGATLAPNGVGVTSSAAASGAVLTNAGTIAPTGGNRAIDITGSAARTLTINNNAGATITAASDTIRLNAAPASGAIVINNAGTISNTGGGQQAIDFRGGTNAGLTTQINNLAGGVISSNSEDAIRGAQGTVITNAGTIQSTTTLNAYGKFDGVDWGGNVGTVVNQTGGLISGVRHGITADTDLNVTNEASATIIGNNGSGVGSDGAGTVVNRGTITGAAVDQYAPSVTDGGDGDGVDIDGIAHITNFGTIQGTGAYGIKDGQANKSEGIAMGGGDITNNAGATIRGAGNGILVDDGNDGPGVASTTLNNAGLIEGLNGAGVKLVGNFADVVANSGTIRSTGGPAVSLGDGADTFTNSGVVTANGGSAIDLGAGNDTLTLMTGSTITGVVDGGAGVDTVNLQQGGAFAGGVNFEALDVQSGVWTLTGAQTYANGSTVRSGATAVVNGTLNGALNVAAGGKLGGSGTVGAVTVNGAIAPGNSIGTTNVGSITFAPGSVYQVETDPAGASDKIVATGTAALNGSVEVLPMGGTYGNITTYRILTAAGGRTGTFTGVTSASAFLVPELSYSSNAVDLTLRRNDVQFADVATNANQSRLGHAITAGGYASAMYQALLPLNAADAATALQQFAGDLHPSIGTALLEDSARANTTMAQRLGLEADGNGAWISSFAEAGAMDAHEGRAKVEDDQRGVFVGADRGVGDWRFGAALGVSTGTIEMTGRRAEANFDSKSLNFYGGGDVGPVKVRVGGGFVEYDIHTGRAVVAGALYETLTSRYGASGGQVFAEASMGEGALQPFAGLSWSALSVDSFAETGGASALSSLGERKPDTGYATIGVRYEQEIGAGVWHGSAAWRNAFKDESSQTLRFGNGSGFVVDGGEAARSVLLLDLSGDFRLGEIAALTLGVDGQVGEDTSRVGANIGLHGKF